jgi:hypothetical protein
MQVYNLSLKRKKEKKTEHKFNVHGSKLKSETTEKAIKTNHPNTFPNEIVLLPWKVKMLIGENTKLRRNVEYFKSQLN